MKINFRAPSRLVRQQIAVATFRVIMIIVKCVPRLALRHEGRYTRRVSLISV